MNKFGPLPDLSFSGITTFARLQHHKCLEDRSKDFDIASELSSASPSPRDGC